MGDAAVQTGSASMASEQERSPTIPLVLDRKLKSSLGDQIYEGLSAAIRDGSLAADARMPSWQDLASQLGVARGTVRRAYERLIDNRLVVSRGPAGTWVTNNDGYTGPEEDVSPPVDLGMFYEFDASPGIFQMGIPGQDAFPLTQWANVCRRAMRDEFATPLVYGDPRGEPSLRREIAAYLAIARGLKCAPEQILITNGFSGALSLLIKALNLEGKDVWVEDPGYTRTRSTLAVAGALPRDCAVDSAGLHVAAAEERWPAAKAAVVTPGQQAPLGVQMSLQRRSDLLHWAARTGAWIIEDDYVGELQLEGRAAPSLAAHEPVGRVFHVGTFSKTLGPRLRIGFVVVPREQTALVSKVAGHLFPSGSTLMQKALAAFISEGHYMRHLRRTKRLYAERKSMIVETLSSLAPEMEIDGKGALSVRVFLGENADDVALAARLADDGFNPAPLSPCYRSLPPRKGLLLGITNLREKTLLNDCRRFVSIIRG